MPVDLKAAAAAARRLHEALALLPVSRWEYPTEYDAEIAKITAIIASEGGAVNDRWDGAAVRMHGLRATSTSGIAGACRNWITQARTKAGEL